jgi:photosystem II stability/assembly factor-like uncharacterized protein
MKRSLFGLLLAAGLAFHWACSGSGAVSPLSPAKAATPEASTVNDSQVVYWAPFPMAAPVTEVLNGVCLLSKKKGWACGNNGLVLKFDGEVWEAVDTGMAKNENLMSIAFANENEGWVVGTHGTILHYNSGSWSLDASQTQELLYGLAVSPSRAIWVAGSNGTLLTYNGVSWGKIAGITGPTAGTTLVEDLYDVGFSGPNSGWAVGNRGTILRFDGQKWQSFPASPTTERINSVSVINDSQAWAVGAYGTILRFNGTVWNKMGSAFSGVDLYKIRMKSDDDGWAVGQDGTLLYYDGTRWISHAKPDGKPSLNALAFYKEVGFVVGQNGTVLHYQPNGELAGLSFLFKGVASKDLTKNPPQWTLAYTVLNQSPKASPLVTFRLPIPKGFEAFTPQPSPTPTGTLPPTATPTQTPTPPTTPDIKGTPTGPVRAEFAGKPMPLGGSWKIQDDRLEWEVGNMAVGEYKSLSILVREKKGEKYEPPVVFKAQLRSNDKVVSEAAPLTLIQAPVPNGSPTPGH